jgi:O6-methylguanine-DNA--protein-cysteine methyltransferase
VIGSDGKLSGYRWGIERKKLILENEAKRSEGKH